MAKVGSSEVFNADLGIKPSAGRTPDRLTDAQLEERLNKSIENDEKEKESVIKPKNTSARSVPKPSSKMIRVAQTFQEWLALLNDEDWTHLSVYLYRLFPKIVRQQSNQSNPNYIDIFGLPFTMDDVVTIHGSGTYMFIVKDSNNVKEAVCKAQFDLNDVDKPAIYILEELDIFHPGNKSTVDKLKSEGKIGIDNKIVGHMTAQPSLGDGNMTSIVMKLLDKMDNNDRQRVKSAAESGNDAAFTKALDLVGQGAKASIDMAMQNMKGDSGEKTVEVMKLMATMMKPEKPEIGIADILKMMNEDRAANQALMIKLLEKKEEDPIDRMLKMQELMQMLKGDDGGKASKDGWKEQLIEVGLPIAAQIAQGLMMFMSTKAQAPTGDAQPNAQQSQSQAQGAIAGQTAPNPSSQAQQVPADPLAQVQLALNQYGGLIISAVGRGEHGADFAAGIDSILGPESGIVRQLQGLGGQALLGALQTHQTLWAKLVTYGADKVAKFVEEFMQYGNESKEESEESEEETE